VDFQRQYDAARQTIQSADDVRRIIREAAEDDAAEGSGWLELQVDPSSYEEYLGGLDPAVEMMVDVCRDAARAVGIGIGLVLAVSWAAAPERAQRIARVAARYADQGVVGFGISNDERLGDPDTFVGASRIARDAGLLVTPHAGFYLDHLHVRRCVELLGASRIGHGITAATSPSTLEIWPEIGSPWRSVPLLIPRSEYSPRWRRYRSTHFSEPEFRSHWGRTIR
jgi:adenosine deaminase